MLWSGVGRWAEIPKLMFTSFAAGHTQRTLHGLFTASSGRFVTRSQRMKGAKVLLLKQCGNLFSVHDRQELVKRDWIEVQAVMKGNNLLIFSVYCKKNGYEASSMRENVLRPECAKTCGTKRVPPMRIELIFAL